MTIHLDQVRRFLTAGYSPEQVARAGAGVWSTAFSFEHEGRPLVVRFGRHVEDFLKDERAATLYGRCIPVPRVLEVGKAFEEYAYAVSEWADGEAIDGLAEPHFRAALLGIVEDAEDPRLAGWRARTSSRRRRLWPGAFGGLRT